MNFRDFFNKWRDRFGYWSRTRRKRYLTQAQVQSIEQIIRFYLSEADRRGIPESVRKYQLAYILATAYHETAGTMLPVRETLARTDAGAIRILTRLYNSGKKNYKYALPHPVTGKSYFGRGFVQTTWYSNYQFMSEVLGVDLVNRPELLLEIRYAVPALVLGLLDGLYYRGRDGRPIKTLSDYINNNRVSRVGARRLVNGTDRAHTIAGLAREIEDML